MRDGLSARACAASLLTAALLLALGAQPVVAGPGDFAGSAHDFTAYAWSNGNPCAVCHDSMYSTPAVTFPADWDHTLSQATYMLYSSSSMKQTVGQPGPRSKLCLSCHDGTVAVDAYGATPTAHQYIISDVNRIGTNLSQAHPIGITYTSTVPSDPSLFDPTKRPVTIGSTKTQSGTIATLMLYGGQLECSSCHDVHNKFTVGNSGLLKLSPASICTTCHNK